MHIESQRRKTYEEAAISRHYTPYTVIIQCKIRRDYRQDNHVDNCRDFWNNPKGNSISKYFLYGCHYLGKFLLRDADSRFEALS